MRKFKFFHRIDQFLLRHYPGIWALQIHRLLPWALIIIAFTGLLVYAQSPQSYSGNQMEIFISWLYFFAVVGLVLWLVYMFRFNPIKNFGKRPPMDELQNLGITFMGIVLLATAPQIFFVARNIRMHTFISEPELAQNLNKINIVLSMNHSLETDSAMIRASDTNRRKYYLDDPTNTKYMDSVYFDKKDSIWHCYDLNHFKNYEIYYGDKENNEVLTGKEIYYVLQGLKTRKDTLRILQDFSVAAERIGGVKLNPETMYRYLIKGIFPANSIPDYRLSLVESTFDDYIREFKSNLNYQLKYFTIYEGLRWNEILRFILYPSFFITLLILMFRNMTLKTFLISIGIGPLLPLVVFLTGLAFGVHGEEGFFAVVLLTYIIIWLIYYSCRNSARFASISGIALNILVFVTPVIGLFFEAWWEQNYRHGIPYELQDHAFLDRVRLTVELVEIPVFLILLQLVFKPLYIRWYSMPRE
ncbi:MAG: hypothetical protein KG003_04600 [Bacteroidetes bacterium]|nr:hypothetical protein [Bacteroidota bacterium]